MGLRLPTHKCVSLLQVASRLVGGQEEPVADSFDNAAVMVRRASPAEVITITSNIVITMAVAITIAIAITITIIVLITIPITFTITRGLEVSDQWPIPSTTPLSWSDPLDPTTHFIYAQCLHGLM